ILRDVCRNLVLRRVPLACRAGGVCFFFRAEDGIRDFHVTGVQTCALPIWAGKRARPPARRGRCASSGTACAGVSICCRSGWTRRSEEHTSELQSRENLVCRLLLEKKKNITEHVCVLAALTRSS